MYYPALQAWTIITGWNVGKFAKVKFSGEEKLYYIDSNDGSVYRAWYGDNDNATAINWQIEGRKEDMGQPLVKKSSGEIKIKMLSSGNYTVTVYASIDDQSYVTVGTISLIGNAPTLPVVLPFTLAETDIVTTTFHLDNFGEWYQLRIKMVLNTVIGSDLITLYEQSIVTYPQEYESE